jgi:hypothetical protein
VNKNNQFVYNPFIIFLSSIYRLVDHANAIFLLRNVIIVFSIILFIFIYLTMKKICNQIISFVGTCVSSFIPLFVSYSANLHNDIFALSLGFISLYFSIMPRKFIQVMLAAIFIILAGLTRPDAFAGFLIPFIIGMSYFISRKIRRNFYFIFGSCLSIFAVLAFVVGQDYYYHTTRFNPVGKITLSLTYDNVMFVWQNLIKITLDDTVNNIFLSSVVIGIIFSLFNTIRILRHVSFSNIQFKEEGFVALYLSLIFVAYFINLVTFHLPYTLTNDTIQFLNFLTPRYLLPLQILLFCAFTYVLKLPIGFRRSIDFKSEIKK